MRVAVLPSFSSGALVKLRRRRKRFLFRVEEVEIPSPANPHFILLHRIDEGLMRGYIVFHAPEETLFCLSN